MKALLVSDVHASYRFLSSVYENFKTNREIKAFIFTGDLVDMGEPVSFVDEFFWLLTQMKLTLLWVPGNNDFGRSYHSLNAKIKSLEGRVIEFANQRFTGVGGSPASWSGQYQGEMSVDKKAIAETIFLSHVPPPGLANFEKIDQSNVSLRKDMALSTALENKAMQGSINRTIQLSDSPKVHICGHIHHTWGLGYLGTTKVIKLAAAYLGYYAIMDLDSLFVEFGRLWK